MVSKTWKGRLQPRQKLHTELGRLLANTSFQHLAGILLVERGSTGRLLDRCRQRTALVPVHNTPIPSLLSLSSGPILLKAQATALLYCIEDQCLNRFNRQQIELT